MVDYFGFAVVILLILPSESVVCCNSFECGDFGFLCCVFWLWVCYLLLCEWFNSTMCALGGKVIWGNGGLRLSVLDCNFNGL